MVEVTLNNHNSSNSSMIHEVIGVVQCQMDGVEDREAEVLKLIRGNLICSRLLGGRDNAFGSNRGNTNADDAGENGGNSNGGGGDDSSAPSSSWSSRGGYHSRGGGSFGNRVRSYDDRYVLKADRKI